MTAGWIASAEGEPGEALAAEGGARLELDVWDALQACSTLGEALLRARLKPETGLSLARHGVLARLYDGSDGMTMGQLARGLRVTGANATALVDALEHDGWVVRQRTPQDRRRMRVLLTETGRSKFPAARRPFDAALADVLAGLSLSEARLLAGLLRKLRGHLQNESATRATRRRGETFLRPFPKGMASPSGWV